MQVKSKVNVRIFDDNNERDALFAPDDQRAEVINASHSEAQWGRFVIAPSGNLTLPLGTVNVAYGLYIRTITDFDLVLSGGDPLTIRKAAGTAAADPIKFYMDGTFTSAEITNASATANLVGYYAIWGDPV